MKPLLCIDHLVADAGFSLEASVEGDRGGASLEKRDARLFGTTLVRGQADDEATKKAIVDAIVG